MTFVEMSLFVVINIVDISLVAFDYVQKDQTYHAYVTNGLTVEHTHTATVFYLHIYSSVYFSMLTFTTTKAN